MLKLCIHGCNKPWNFDVPLITEVDRNLIEEILPILLLSIKPLSSTLHCLTSCETKHEVLYFGTISKPGLKFVVLDLSRAIIIDYLELCICKLLDTDPTRFWQPSHFAKTKDRAHNELAQLLSVQIAVPRNIEGLENHQG